MRPPKSAFGSFASIEHSSKAKTLPAELITWVMRGTTEAEGRDWPTNCATSSIFEQERSLERFCTVKHRNKPMTHLVLNATFGPGQNCREREQ